jgi:hypothetical protein
VVFFQIVVVFYVAIVLLLIGTNLRANRGAGRGARFKKHVVEFAEGKAESKLVPQREAAACDFEEDAIEV